MSTEEKRLQALYKYDILDTKEEEAYNNIAKLAAYICDAPGAMINFIDKDRQWTKASYGWLGDEMPRDISFCHHTIQEDDGAMIISDAYEDERFTDNPLVRNDPPLRFYAGVTIKGLEEHPLGSLCIYDSDPKDLSQEDLEALRILADEVETHLQLRLNQEELKKNLLQENKLNENILHSLPLNFFMYDKNGEIVRWNNYMETVTGYTDEEIQHMNPEDYFNEEEREKVRKKMKAALDGEQVTFEADFRKKDGTTAPYIFSATRVEISGEPYLIGTGQNITELKQTQEKLLQSLDEKQTLLAEIHHRVKNNLAVISGMIQFEAMENLEDETKQKLYNTMLRIHSMAEVHEVMYQTENLSHVSFDKVIKNIVDNVKETFSQPDNIVFQTNADGVILNVNQAIPSGIIVSELVTNALKYAYSEDERGKINVEMTEDHNVITLRVSDQGEGIPEDKGPGISHTVGFTLVDQLCKQLNADIEVDRSTGTEYTITFEKKNAKGSGNNL